MAACLVVPAHALLYSLTDLGTFGGTVSESYGINNSGTVVGFAYTTGNAATLAFSYSSGVMTNLGTLGGTNSYLFNSNINSAGSCHPSSPHGVLTTVPSGFL
jgi:probable HAF family extracellular repeat protein